MRFKSHYVPDFSNRNPEPITNKLFSERWSPRAFKKATIPSVALEAIFDAARWSPSCFNEQPWQFITATAEAQNTHFERFLKLLVGANQVWAKNASLLGFIVAKRCFARNDKTNPSANFDCGSAWMAMSLQANLFGLFSHAMAGIKYDEIYTALNIDADSHEVICGFALGVLDTPDSLPEAIQDDEKPSSRKPLKEIWQQY
jgi:nitroreductase